MRQQLSGGNRDVSGTGGEVQKQNVEISPPHIGQELLEGSVQHRPAKRHGCLDASRFERQHRHNPDPMSLRWHQHSLDHGRRVRGAEDARYGVPVHIGIEQADAQALACEGDGEVRGD